MLVDRGGRGRPRHDRDLLEPGLAQREPASSRARRGRSGRGWTRAVARAGGAQPRLRFARLDAINRSPANCQPHDPTLHTLARLHLRGARRRLGHGAYRARVVQRGGPYAMRTAFEPEDLTALTMLGGAWSVEEGVLVAPARRRREVGRARRSGLGARPPRGASGSRGRQRGARGRGQAGRATRSWRSSTRRRAGCASSGAAAGRRRSSPTRPSQRRGR